MTSNDHLLRKFDTRGNFNIRYTILQYQVAQTGPTAQLHNYHTEIQSSTAQNVRLIDLNRRTPYYTTGFKDPIIPRC